MRKQPCPICGRKVKREEGKCSSSTCPYQEVKKESEQKEEE